MMVVNEPAIRDASLAVGDRLMGHSLQQLSCHPGRPRGFTGSAAREADTRVV